MLKFKTYPDLDYASERKIRQFQTRKIREVVHYVYSHSKFYQRLFKREGLKPSQIKSLKDLEKIPLTTKDDLRKKNFDFVCAPHKEWADLFTTGGTTGLPVYLPQTKNDLSRTAWAEERTLRIAGIKKEDLVQFNMPMSTAMWGAGLSYWMGYQLIGAGVLRSGPGFAEQQIQNMERLKATVIHSQSSFLIRLGLMAKEKGVMKRLKIRLLLAGLENILNEDFSRNELGKKLEEVWKGCRVCAVYGNSESASPVNECQAESGYHLTSEFCYLEIVDSKTGKVLPPGEKGMMVITPFNLEGLPLLRYALGDVSFIIEGRCKCGRTAPRLGPILGRTDDMMKIKGVIVYPSGIEDIILSVKEVSSYYIEVDKDKNFMDQVRVYAAPKRELSKDEKERLSEEINYAIKSKLQISAKVTLRSPQEIQEKVMPKGSTKPKKFWDLRSKKEKVK